MANENELSNLQLPTDAISVAMSEAFVAAAFYLPFVYTEEYPDDTKLIKFRKRGSGTAQTVAEGGNYSVGAGSEITDSSVSATAEKKVFSTTHTVEQGRFGGIMGRLPRFTQEHARAIARLFDADVKTLHSSLSNTQTATATLTAADVLDALQQVEEAADGAFSGTAVGTISHKQANDLRKVLAAVTATPFSSQLSAGLLGPIAPANVKEYLGVNFIATSGLPTDTGDDVGAIFDPSLCFAAGVDGRGGFESEVRFVGNQGLHYEFTTWTYWKAVLWNDTAGVALKSDS